MKNSTHEYLNKFMDAAMPASFAGSISYHGIQELPWFLFDKTKLAYYSYLSLLYPDNRTINNALRDFEALGNNAIT